MPNHLAKACEHVCWTYCEHDARSVFNPPKGLIGITFSCGYASMKDEAIPACVIDGNPKCLKYENHVREEVPNAD